MTLRNARGGDVQDVFREVDDLLDSDDALMVSSMAVEWRATPTGSQRRRANSSC